MNLDKEIKEVKSSFRKGNILNKTLSIIGFFTVFSSLTSLSSTIIQWKGFILEAISFYHVYFVDRISHVALEVGLTYSQEEVHVAIISSISISLGMRILALGQKAAFNEINKQYNSDLFPNLTIFWLISCIAPVCIWIWYGVSNPIIHPWRTIIAFFLCPFFIILPKIIMEKFNYKYFEKNTYNYFKSYYLYVASLFVIIGILAAINSGLKNSEPSIRDQPDKSQKIIEAIMPIIIYQIIYRE
ncbi:MAG: heme transporter CcmC [Gammaproteobacteria bacterium]|nr:MAG: heme transporter CcmC [Gammaproteobacteria bacterium]